MSMWTPDAHSLRHVEEYLRSRGMERLVMPAIGSLLVNWQRKTEKGSAIDTSIFVLYIVESEQPRAVLVARLL